MNALSVPEMTGRARSHLAEVPELQCWLHRDVVAPLRNLRVAAWAEAGLDVVPVSAFRDFERQRLIWNGKFRGERPVLDRDSKPIDALALDPPSRVDAILAWSAPPGASRHHWGTDFDVIDRLAMPEGYRPQLVPREYAPGGVFAELGRWLDASLHRFGFFRPFRRSGSGVQPEPWHLSYAPLAERVRAAFTVEVLREAFGEEGVDGSDVLLARAAELHARYIDGIDPP